MRESSLCCRLCLLLDNVQPWHVAGSGRVSLLLGGSGLLGALLLLLVSLILNGLCAEDLYVQMSNGSIVSVSSVVVNVVLNEDGVERPEMISK